jgi:predicted phage terminase large subunit-like protein
MSEQLKQHRRQRAEESLYDFVKQYWHIVEPSNPMIEGWLMDAICLHLSAITTGDILRLIVNVPPGSSKSLLSSVFWPAWEWGPRNMASMRYAAFSYSSSLTERDNDRMMNLITSPEYRENWGDRFGVYGGNIKVKNTKTGWKLATSVAGVGTGERGDRLILDDLNNVKEVESEAIRNNTNQWIREVMPTRLNHLAKSAVVAIQQRTHEEDCTGTLVSSRDDWTWLMVPMRYDPFRHCTTSIGWSDPRTVEGEICWPERFPEESIAPLEREMGPYAWAGQMQQSPSARGGGIIKREWWQDWTAKNTPPLDFIIASLDTAMTEKEEADYSALTVWGSWQDSGSIVGDEYGGYDFVASNTPREFDEEGRQRTPVTMGSLPKILLLNAWRDRLDVLALAERVVATCLKYRVDLLVIENKANGWAVNQALRSLFDNKPFSVTMFDPRKYGDKSARLYSVQHLFAEGLIYAPLDKAWADMTITEIAMFPRAAHDDLADSAVQALISLRMRGFMQRKEEVVGDVIGSLRHKPKMRPLYPS